MRSALVHTLPDSDMAESPPSDRIPITIEITPEQQRRTERLAEQQGVSLEDAVRKAIEHEIAASASNGDEAAEAEPGSFLSRTRPFSRSDS